MAVDYKDIYDKFTIDIDDSDLGLVSDIELNNILFKYLEKARAMYFPQCTKDLNDVTVTISDIDTIIGIGDDAFVINEISAKFNQDLTNQEQHILALGMKKAWLSSKKYSADLMVKDVGDRDYNAVQGFNYLKVLITLDSELEDEIRSYGTSYTYSVEELRKGF